MLVFRNANLEDTELYYNWANDPAVRVNSFNTSEIKYCDHERWFKEKVLSSNTLMLVFEDANECVGQVRIEKKDEKHFISLSVDKKHRGKGYSTIMISQACEVYFNKFKANEVVAEIKPHNLASKKSFEMAQFILVNEFQDKLVYKKIRNV